MLAKKRILLVSGTLALTPVLLFAFYMLSKTPDHRRNWKIEQKVLPNVQWDGEHATVRNIRDFRYWPDGTVREVRYYDGTFDLHSLQSVWFGISHFADRGLAHTFLSFGFQGERYLTVSVEARLEVGESYRPVAGLFRNYELVYIVADERDAIGLRTHIRKEKVYLYRLDISPETAKKVFEEMLAAINEIARKPRFYNTLLDNCTTNLLDRAEDLSVWERFFDYRVLLPGYSDELAYEKGVLRDDIPLEKLREYSLLDPVRCGIDNPGFSTKMRNR